MSPAGRFTLLIFLSLIALGSVNSNDPNMESTEAPQKEDPGESPDGDGGEKPKHETEPEMAPDSADTGDENPSLGCFTPGEPQSTVNLEFQPEEAEDSDEKSEEKWRKLQVNRYYGVLRDRFYIQNRDGGMVVIQLRHGEPTSEARIRGSEKDWNYEYILAKLDIFWSKSNTFGAQHSIGGETYPFEVQFVHYQKKFKTLSDASDSKHGILVICVLFEVTGAQNPSMDSLAAAALMSAFPQDSPQVAHGPLDVKGLFPYDLTNIQYTGTYMVKPYCNRESKFVVFINPRQISFKQLKKFREIRDTDGEKNPGMFSEKDSVTLKKTEFSKHLKLTILRSTDIPDNGSECLKPSCLLYAIISMISWILLRFIQN